MFTSRAEFRLSLRADNADQRLTPLGISLGCVRADRRKVFEDKAAALLDAKKALASQTFTPRELGRAGIKVSQDGERRTALAVLAFADVQIDQVCALAPAFSAFDKDIQLQVARDSLYSQYLDRQQNDVNALKKDEDMFIPNGFEYIGLPGLSNELSAKLERVRPTNLAQAGRIEGMTPSALTLVLAHLRKQRREVTA